jgi:Asp-tRNA(Asn)/Glu-tRNA(Gln) amidotransferase A subunit family amidase
MLDILKNGLELTKLFLNRLKKYDPQLHCVISLTEDLALREAASADREIAAGKYRGPLHGIPYGAKDLLAAKGYRTTWGAMPYKDQIIDRDATVIQKLRAAGAAIADILAMVLRAMTPKRFVGRRDMNFVFQLMIVAVRQYDVNQGSGIWLAGCY